MKITFVDPFDYSLGTIEKPRKPPLGILSLTQVINNDGKHSAEVVSLSYEYYKNNTKLNKDFQENIKNDADIIASTFPDAVSIYTMCNTYHIALFLARRLKKLRPNLKIILGGPQATIVAKETLEKYEYIDAIGLREGEATIIGILDALQNTNFSQAKGVAFRIKDEIIVKENDELIEDLDTLPIIEFDKFEVKEGSSIGIDVGRGCPYNCTFCSTKAFWKRKFRMKSAERILGEIEYYMEKYNVRMFDFKHDLFVANRALVMNLCELISEKNLDIDWTCSARVDTVDEELLKTMSKAGCRDMFLGVESGSERMQKLIKKNLKIDDVKTVLELLVKYKINTTISFIYGFPEETERDLEETTELMTFIRERYFEEINSKKMILQLHKIMFLPATEITTQNLEKLVYVKENERELFGGANIWNDEELDTMLGDIKIFPNHAYIPTELAEKTKNLDIFVLVIYPYVSATLNFTFKCLLEEFEGSMLKLFYSFSDIISEADFRKLKYIYENELEEGEIRLEPIFKAFFKFIDEYEFSKFDARLLKEVIDFEYNRMKLVVANKKQDNYWAKKYTYNVIGMIKGKEIINKIGNYFVGFRIRDEKFSIKYI